VCEREGQRCGEMVLRPADWRSDDLETKVILHLIRPNFDVKKLSMEKLIVTFVCINLKYIYTTSNSCIFTPIENWSHVYMNLFTRNSPYYHLLKYLLFLLKRTVYVHIRKRWWGIIRKRTKSNGWDVNEVCKKIVLEGTPVHLRTVAEKKTIT